MIFHVAEIIIIQLFFRRKYFTNIEIAYGIITEILLNVVH